MSIEFFMKQAFIPAPKKAEPVLFVNPFVKKIQGLTHTKTSQGAAIRNIGKDYPTKTREQFGDQTLTDVANKQMGAYMFSKSKRLADALVFARQQAQSNIIKKHTDTATALAVKGATDAFQKQLTEAQLDYERKQAELQKTLFDEAIKVPYLEKDLADTQSKYLALVNAPPVEKENWDLFGGIGDALKGAVPYLIIGGVALLGIFMFTRRE